MHTSDSYILQETGGGHLLLEQGGGALILEDAQPAPDVDTGGGGKLRRRRQPLPPEVKPSAPLNLRFGTALVYVFALQPRLSVTASPGQAQVRATSHTAQLEYELDASAKVSYGDYISPIRDTTNDRRLTPEDVWAAARMSTGRS